MKVESKLRQVVEGDSTCIYVDTLIDGDISVVSPTLFLSMPTKNFPECDIEVDSWEEIVKMICQGSWYKRGEAGRKALDAENAKDHERRNAARTGQGSSA